LKNSIIKGVFLFVFFLIILLPCNIYKFNILDSSNELENQESIQISAEIPGTKQWLVNPNFSSQEHWISSSQGDSTDVNATISGGKANFEILGNKSTTKIIANQSTYTEWTPVRNPAFPAFPDDFGIDQGGFWAKHEWNEDSNQSTSVHWDKTITMPVDMSDYIITSASLKATVNATADLNVEAPTDSIYGGTEYATSDYVRFYVLISDLEKNKIYEIAYNQTVNLGLGNTTGTDYMFDTDMKFVLTENLIFYLSSVLNTDYQNFILTLGLRIWCEDNFGSDTDTFDDLRIKYFNLTFTYEKKIDQFTAVSWNQIGNKISGISNYTVIVKEAKINFKYKIDQLWPTYISPNSEIKILINNNPHSETIKLSRASTSFKEIKPGGFDLTSSIKDDINLSIQIFIADNFGLGQKIVISIDDVSLYISYIIIEPDVLGPNWSWLIYTLFGGIIGIIVIFTLYQTYFKYPPMIRKIRKLKKLIRNDKTSKSVLVKKRDEYINRINQDQIINITTESIHPKKDFMIEKMSLDKDDN